MAGLKWVTPIAAAIAIAESEWKREIEKASALFKWWKNQYPHDTELDWMFYSRRQVIQSRTAKHVWDRYQSRYNKMVLVPYDKYQRMLDKQSFKTPTAPKPKKKKKDQMTYPSPWKQATSTHRKSDVNIDWISF